MAKTFTSSLPTVSTGDVYQATSHNNIVTTLNNHTVPPMATVPLTSNQSVTNNADTVLGFQAAVINPGSDITVTSGAVSTTYANGGKITVSTTGVYLVSYCIQFDLNTTGVRAASIALNGTGSPSSALGSGWAQSIGVNASTTLQNSVLISLTAADYIQLAVRQTSGGSLNSCASASYINLVWVGKTA